MKGVKHKLWRLKLGQRPCSCRKHVQWHFECRTCATDDDCAADNLEALSEPAAVDSAAVSVQDAASRVNPSVGHQHQQLAAARLRLLQTSRRTVETTLSTTAACSGRSGEKIAFSSWRQPPVQRHSAQPAGAGEEALARAAACGSGRWPQWRPHKEP